MSSRGPKVGLGSGHLIFSFPQHSRPHFTRKKDTRSESLDIPINVVLPQVGRPPGGCRRLLSARITLVRNSRKMVQDEQRSQDLDSSCGSAANQLCALGGLVAPRGVGSLVPRVRRAG